ncbi:hypothetical protein Pint_10084 [Pistacia integerrima]|uniref:Uncharacterized protein n=1 Tax=Pistacia integerrima TaxID=434235 RepID=A0ACC0XNC7_9ROSI|nr:hypothetical protein Pint_10084 [Pistacia integerrima]
MATKMFDKMRDRNVVSWTTMINGYLQFGHVDKAERLFYEMPIRDVAASNSMIHGYCCNGRVEDALRLFEETPCRNVISWTSMISGLDSNGRHDESLFLFKKMVGSGVQVHGNVIKIGFCFDEFICASLIMFSFDGEWFQW